MEQSLSSKAALEASETMEQVKAAFLSNLEMGLASFSKALIKSSGKPGRKSGELNLNASANYEKQLEKIKNHVVQRIEKYFPTLEEFVCQRLLAAPALLEESYENELRNGVENEDEASLLEEIDKEIEAVDAEIADLKTRIESLVIEKKLLNDYNDKIAQLQVYAQSLGDSVESAEQLFTDLSQMLIELSSETQVVLSKDPPLPVSNPSSMDDAALEAMLSGLPRQSDFLLHQ